MSAGTGDRARGDVKETGEATDPPPQPGAGRRLPGIFQYLPPPVGIAQTPPVVDQPLPAAVPTTASVDDGERPASADRAHPRRAHARPVAARVGATASPDRPGPGAGAEPVGDPGGSVPVAPPPLTSPPMTSPPVAATRSARVRVPAVSARVKPSAVLGRELPEVRVETPGATVDMAAGLTALP